MEFLGGLIFIPIGAFLSYLGVKMFIESDGWFFFVKAITVTLIGIACLLGGSAAWFG
jgi:hypothetical protein